MVSTRVRVVGSASQIRLLIRGQKIATWLNDTKNPNIFGGTTNSYPFPSKPRKVWSDGSYPEWNLKHDDLQGEKLSAGETIAYDGNFSSNFNATVDYSYTIYEVIS
ncbi:MAG: hypothetical protein OEL84_04675 [Nitrosopumilus sp.]|nr:hypothetical protein [Nitrosopumilus sp.]MDH3340564.1 hypothetical protein [Nitrosopumilus sp.]